jgi:monovalent cation:H+ antiporter-2, CPA2 family
MEANPILFRDLTYIFVAAVFGGLVAWRLRLPLIIGFVLGGIAISPFTPGPQLSDLHTFEVFAEVGVVLLMFSIGVEFSIPELMRVKSVALIGGPIGILLIVLLSIGAGRVFGWSITESFVIGATVSVASTMVLARLLSDSGRLATTNGRVMIGITIVEDLAVICMAVVIPVLANSREGGWLMAIWVLGKALLLLIPLTFLAIKVIPPLLRRVKRTCNAELQLLVAISICFGTAALAHAAGFSVALGAFLAGVSISSLPELHDANSRLLPLRDAFVALFFVTLGTLIDPRLLSQHLPLLGAMLLLIVVGKLVVWTAVVWFFRHSFRTAITVAAGLTQIGELSFVVVQVARSSGLVDEGIFGTAIAASLISILLNVFLVRAVFRWTARETGETAMPKPCVTKPAEVSVARLYKRPNHEGHYYRGSPAVFSDCAGAEQCFSRGERRGSDRRGHRTSNAAARSLGCLLECAESLPTFQQAAQKCAYRVQCLVRSVHAPDTIEEGVWHALPHVELGVDAGCDGAFHIASRVVEQHFIISHVDADRRQSRQIPKKR